MFVATVKNENQVTLYHYRKIIHSNFNIGGEKLLMLLY